MLLLRKLPLNTANFFRIPNLGSIQRPIKRFSSSSKMRQEGIVHDFAFGNLTASDLEASADDLIRKTRSDFQKVGDLGQDQVDFKTCIKVRKTLLISSWRIVRLN